MTVLRASLARTSARTLPSEQLQNLALLQLTLIVMALVSLALRA